jgi:predicted XRE-type DNA-binding protein
LGFDEQEATNLKIKADLLLDLRQYTERGWTRAQAVAFFLETQPRISDLLAGEVSRFNIDKLINMLPSAGYEYGSNPSFTELDIPLARCEFGRNLPQIADLFRIEEAGDVLIMKSQNNDDRTNPDATGAYLA